MPGTSGEEKMESNGALFWSDENVLQLDRSGGCTPLWMYCHLNRPLKVNFVM